MNYPDYLLIKDLPGYKAGCIFTIGHNYIYYIKYNPEQKDWVKLDDIQFDGCVDSLLRFNIYQMDNNPDYFKKIDTSVNRDIKIENILT